MERDLKMFSLTCPSVSHSCPLRPWASVSFQPRARKNLPALDLGRGCLRMSWWRQGRLSYHYADLCQILCCFQSSSFVLNVSVPSTWDLRALMLSTLSAPSRVSARELVAVLHTQCV